LGSFGFRRIEVGAPPHSFDLPGFEQRIKDLFIIFRQTPQQVHVTLEIRAAPDTRHGRLGGGAGTYKRSR